MRKRDEEAEDLAGTLSHLVTVVRRKEDGKNHKDGGHSGMKENGIEKAREHTKTMRQTRRRNLGGSYENSKQYMTTYVMKQEEQQLRDWTLWRKTNCQTHRVEEQYKHVFDGES